MAIQPSKRIPTNVVTGFLGVGKTTAIRHLLKSKPVDEQWAVLVNEFGEVGIDGALLQANDDMVTQVAGGCTCCKVQSLSRVALQHLIDEHKPDRLIIEPTGLAMPKQIMEMLGTEKFLAQLEVQAMVCLVDPYFFKDESFLNMEACADQIAMADVVIATKADIADEEDLAAFTRYMGRYTPAKQAVTTMAHGQMDWRLLTHSHLAERAIAATGQHAHASDSTSQAPLPNPDPDGVIKLENRAEFGFSCGWMFTPDWTFDSDKLLELYRDLTVPRIKGVFTTRDGWISINKMRDTVSSESVEVAQDSRVEMLALEETTWAEIDRRIRACAL